MSPRLAWLCGAGLALLGWGMVGWLVWAIRG